MRLDSVKMIAFLAAPNRSSSPKARSRAVSSALPLALSRVLVASVLKWRSYSISCAMASRLVRLAAFVPDSLSPHSSAASASDS